MEIDSMEGTNNLVIFFFSWWYGEAYLRLFKYIKTVYIYLTDLFSVRICLKTLFAVWKRDFTSYEGLSLREKFQIFSLNLASRIIGFLIKAVTLFSYLVALVVATFLAVTVVIIWPLYPLLVIYIIYLGVAAVL